MGVVNQARDYITFLVQLNCVFIKKKKVYCSILAMYSNYRNIV